MPLHEQFTQHTQPVHIPSLLTQPLKRFLFLVNAETVSLLVQLYLRNSPRARTVNITRVTSTDHFNTRKAAATRARLTPSPGQIHYRSSSR